MAGEQVDRTLLDATAAPAAAAADDLRSTLESQIADAEKNLYMAEIPKRKQRTEKTKERNARPGKRRAEHALPAAVDIPVRKQARRGAASSRREAVAAVDAVVVALSPCSMQAVTAITPM